MLHRIGERLSAATPEIIERYRQNLVESANPAGTTPERWAETLVHAQLLLGNCVHLLDLPEARATDQHLEEVFLASAPEGGLWNCCKKVRLSDCLRAMEALVRHTLDMVVELAGDVPEAQRAGVVARSTRVINQVASLYIQTAALSYDVFLLQQIEQANSDDRGLLARDIHDYLGNSLVLAFRHLELYRTKMSGENPAAEAHLAAIEASLKEATSFTRGLISGLRAEAPLTSLAEAITGCAAALNFRDLPVDISVHGDETWLPDHHRDELFLILREFLRNSFAHAVPDAVKVRIRISPARVDVEAFDEGHGFIVGERRRASEHMTMSAGGTGLAVMRERTEQLGGQFSLSSSLGRGTRMLLWVPLPKRAQGKLSSGATTAQQAVSRQLPQRASTV